MIHASTQTAERLRVVRAQTRGQVATGDGVEVIVVANASRREQRSLSYQLGRGPSALSFFLTPWQLRDVMSLEVAHVPRCIVLDMTAPGADHFVAWLRGNYRYSMVPVIGLVNEPSNDRFRRAFAAGVDDVVLRHDRTAIVRRIDLLHRKERQAPIRKDSREALLVLDTVDKRQVLGRVLRLAGFNVTLASNHAEAHKRLQQGRFDLLVAQAQDTTKGWDFVRDARAWTRDDVPAVLVTPVSSKENSAGEATPRTARIALDAPADDLLFAANDVMMPEVKRVRNSPRVLFGTTCAFREPGRMHPRYAFTYNMSDTGLYVRTMDAPAVGSIVWITVTPPYGTEAITVSAKVMWVCEYGSHVGGASPFGFGAQILTENANTGLAKYREGYAKVADGAPVPSDDPAWQRGTVDATFSSIRASSFLPLFD